ncbi:MAG: class I SAM-dependent methyltransferase [Rhodocyclaceae bacterium]|nr:class I SAM-dependent methyltransferase [Rhodocyclaceae bacterium]
MSSKSALHVYRRSMLAEGQSSLTAIAGRIPPGATILDVGCGTGALGAALAEGTGCQFDGITYNPEEAELAMRHYRRVEVLDLDAPAPLASWPLADYDVIVCADILEHLRRPQDLLHELRGRLKPEGSLIVSVPNVGYFGLVAEILAGDFRYRDEGLLDRTHLRFFTRRSISRLLAECGWQLHDVTPIRRDLFDSEFKAELAALPPSVARHLLALPDGDAYQLVLEAGLSSDASEGAVAREPDAGANAPGFSASVYLRYQGIYSEQHRLFARGRLGDDRQTLAFTLPAGTEAPERIRFDPADRPGTLRIHSIRLRDGSGDEVWSWDGRAGALAEGLVNQLVLGVPDGASEGCCLELLGDDPFFELPVPQGILAAAQPPLGLEIALSWPMSADFRAAANAFAAAQDDVRQLRDRVRQLEGAAQALQSLGAERDRLQGELQAIVESTVFKATRPLVRLKMVLDRWLGSDRRR